MYYCEITLLPSSEIPLSDITGRIFGQLHIAFVEAQNHGGKEYGVSFPKYVEPSEKRNGFIGNKIRVFAESKDDLCALNLNHYFSRFEDFVHITSPRLVPVTDKFLVYKRAHNLNATEKARRYAKRHGLSEEEAERIRQSIANKTKFAFIRLFSATSRKNFALFIKQKHTEESGNKRFDSYGLSCGGCVPDF